MKKVLLYDGYFRHVGYMRDGKPPLEVIEATNVISVLIHNLTDDTVLFVRQIRPSMKREDNPEGKITETVGGRFDRPLNVVELIVAETKEELGVTLDPKDVHLLNNGKPLAVSAGLTTERAYLAHAYIRHTDQIEADRIFGLEEEGERIERIIMPAEDFIRLEEVEDLRVFAFQQYLETTHMS